MVVRKHWHSAHTGRLLLLTIAVTAFTVVTMILVEITGGPSAFRTLIANAGPWTPVVYILLKAATYVVAPLSGTSVKLASGALFGVWEGMLLSVAGDALGSCLNYWIARTLGRAGIAKFAGKQSLKQVDHVANRARNWRILLAARLILSFMYDFISYAAGLARFNFSQFLAISTIGSVPISLLYALIGDAAVESSTISHVMIALFSVVLTVAIVAYIYHRHQHRGKPPVEDTLGGVATAYCRCM